MGIIGLPGFERALSQLTLEDLKGEEAELAYDIALGLSNEHAAIFEEDGSLYSLVTLAQKISTGASRKQKALAKKTEKLLVLCADIIQEKGERNKEKGGLTLSSLSAATKQKGKLESEGPMLPKWVAVISKTEKRQEKLQSKIENLRGKSEKEKGEHQKRLDAMELVYKLTEYSMELYRDWASSLGIGKEDQKMALAYAKRLVEEQAYRISKENISRIMQSKEPGVAKVKGNRELLAPGIENEKLDFLIAQGYQISTVTDHNSREFVAAYAVLRQHFGPDELDPPTDLMGMMDAGPVFGKAYQRYFLVTATDPGGRLVGAHDGNYFGSSEASALYGAHIGVYLEGRKLGVATLLHEAALTIGNQYAADAEKEWGKRGTELDYEGMVKKSMEPGDRRIRGNRLMYLVGEVEPVNLASMKDAQATIERNVIHGRMFAFSVIPTLDYKQVDLNWPPDKPYVTPDGKPPADWETVPLLLYVRRIGKEGATKITVAEAKKISRIMADLFSDGGMYSLSGVEADYQHSIARMTDLKDTDRVPLIELPRDQKSTKAELVSKVIDFIPQIGTMHDRCEEFYADYLWSKQYLEKYKQALRSGTAVTLEQAHEYIVKAAKKDPEIRVERD